MDECPFQVALAEEAIALALARESLRHPKHSNVLVPLRKRLERVLIRRWNKQQRAFITEARHWLGRFAQGLHAHEAVGDLKTLRLVTARINAGTALSQAPSRSDTAAYNAAIEAAVSGAIDNLSVDLMIESAATAGKDFARAYLADNGFQQLAADIDATTRERMANAVSNVFAENGTLNDAVQAIKDTFTSMKESRATTIANTELADAYNQAMLSSAKESGDLLKTWNLDGEGCPICQDNAADGAIELDEDFSSGDDAPPAHPNCDCSIGFERSPDAEPEEVTGSGGLKYDLPPIDKDNEDARLILVDVDKLDAAWKKDANFYIGAKGDEHEIGNRRAIFEKWLQDHPGTAINAPRIGWDRKTNRISFIDGRHRFAVLRDMGQDTVGVSLVDQNEDAADFAEQFGPEE